MEPDTTTTGENALGQPQDATQQFRMDRMRKENSTVPRTTPATDAGISAAEDAEELVTALLTASRALVGVSARSLAQVEDSVTITQFRMLVVLEEHGTTRLNLLAERLGVTPSTALRMVDRLISAGMVTRQENTADRREVLIALSEAGQRIVRVVTERRRAEIAAIVAAMPNSRRRAAVSALTAFAEAAGEVPAGTDAAARLGW